VALLDGQTGRDPERAAQGVDHRDAVPHDEGSCGVTAELEQPACPVAERRRRRGDDEPAVEPRAESAVRIDGLDVDDDLLRDSRRAMRRPHCLPDDALFETRPDPSAGIRS
jgi:hypothetical protein